MTLFDLIEERESRSGLIRRRIRVSWPDSTIRSRWAVYQRSAWIDIRPFGLAEPAQLDPIVFGDLFNRRPRRPLSISDEMFYVFFVCLSFPSLFDRIFR